MRALAPGERRVVDTHNSHGTRRSQDANILYPRPSIPSKIIPVNHPLEAGSVQRKPTARPALSPRHPPHFYCAVSIHLHLRAKAKREQVTILQNESQTDGPTRQSADVGLAFPRYGAFDVVAVDFVGIDQREAIDGRAVGVLDFHAHTAGGGRGVVEVQLLALEGQGSEDLLLREKSGNRTGCALPQRELMRTPVPFVVRNDHFPWRGHFIQFPAIIVGY